MKGCQGDDYGFANKGHASYFQGAKLLGHLASAYLIIAAVMREKGWIQAFHAEKKNQSSEVECNLPIFFSAFAAASIYSFVRPQQWRHIKSSPFVSNELGRNTKSHQVFGAVGHRTVDQKFSQEPNKE